MDTGERCPVGKPLKTGAVLGRFEGESACNRVLERRRKCCWYRDSPRIDLGAVGQADCHKDAGDGRRRNRGTAKRQRGYRPVAGELAGLAAEEIAWIESQDSLQDADARRFHHL